MANLEQFITLFSELSPQDTIPKPCPEHGTPDIRSVGNRVQLRCACRTVEEGSGPEAVKLWDETL